MAESQIATTRELVLGDDGTPVSRSEFYDRLRERGATVIENPDDENRPANVDQPAAVSYQNLPDDLSLSAAEMALETGNDPAEYIWTGDSDTDDAARYGLDNRDGQLHCPNENCDWWVPDGMGYMFIDHHEETDHGETPP